MTQILKRLEIIKNSIAIEDEEVIELQIAKLKQLLVDDDVKAIINGLEKAHYSLALGLIESYLSRYSGVSVYVDKELSSLKLELKSLEAKLQECLLEKQEYLSDIEAFNREYNLRLGELIKEILHLRKEIAYKKTIKQSKLKAHYKENLDTFEETKKTIEELKKTMKELEDALEEIDEEDENFDELSSTYKELQEALHILEEDLELQEEELENAKEFIEDESIEKEYEEVKAQFEEYGDEYEQIKESQRILASLESGSGFELTSDSINDKELLKAKIEEYKNNIAQTEAEIETIKEDDTYQTIFKLDDWDVYFETIKNELKEEIERLKEETMGVIAEQTREEDLPAKKIEYLSIELTSIDYLIEDIAIDMRESLLDNNLLNPILSIEHEKNNSYDNLAIKIYCNQIFIGYVLKYKDRENIDSFSFENDQLKNIKAEFIEGCLCLSREI